MTDADFDAEYAEQQLALHDTIACDDIYAQASRQARDSGFAQLILERRPTDYELVDGRAPDALQTARLHGVKVHVILHWEA